MSFLDRLRQVGEPTFDKQRAVMTIVTAAILADGEVSDDEVRRLRGMCALSPIFSHNSGDQDTEVIKFAVSVNGQSGERALGMAAASLSQTLRQTAFAFSCDMLLADGVVNEGEKQFIAGLAKTLGIDEATADAVILTTLIRNYTA
jgi:uncharacterized tellurite resistance protein B-like protein